MSVLPDFKFDFGGLAKADIFYERHWTTNVTVTDVVFHDEAMIPQRRVLDVCNDAHKAIYDDIREAIEKHERKVDEDGPEWEPDLALEAI